MDNSTIQAKLFYFAVFKKFNKIQRKLGRTEIQKKQTTRNGKNVRFYNLIKR